MTETIGQKQRRFTRMIAQLIEYVHQNGYELSFGVACRDPRAHGLEQQLGGSVFCHDDGISDKLTINLGLKQGLIKYKGARVLKKQLLRDEGVV